jgi:hypothetical protein
MTIGWTHTVVYHLALSTNAPQDLVTALYEEFADELSETRTGRTRKKKG